MRVAIDTETTGLDFWHGARPYLVTAYISSSDESLYWEWPVDPVSRKVFVRRKDLKEIWQLVNDADELILHNAKFDVLALEFAFGEELKWPWHKTHDTLIAAHLLASNHDHSLSALSVEYLSVSIRHLERRLEKAVKEARNICRSSFKEWRIAAPGLKDMPSAKTGVWKFDSWLPKRLAEELGYEESHEWFHVCLDYALTDSNATFWVFDKQRVLIDRQGLWSIYETRMKALPIALSMEKRGVTVSGKRLAKLQSEYKAEIKKLEAKCYKIAKRYGYSLSLPKSSTNNSLREFLFNVLKLKPVKYSDKTGEPSLDKEVIDTYLSELDEKSLPYKFLEALKERRKRMTALIYMEGYTRFWLPLNGHAGWYVLHPTLNPTGTDTLRWSSSNPNEQNISKQEGFNLRYCFGPAPGREWWSLDAANIELRIPAYEAGEQEMIELFERPEDPPYYGSYHLLVFSILHPDKWAKYGAKCKEVYKSTWYQWTKNGNFAVQYGAVEESGTADRAYRVPGAQRMIRERFRKIDELNKKLIAFASKRGYVETIPDKTVNPERGYPILCSRSKFGGVKPTVPLNYHVQGTACWWMLKAMIRCSAYLNELNKRDKRGYYMILQVHDELVFDFPKGKGKKPWLTNLPKIRTIKRLMEQGGDDIGVPTPVEIEYHAEDWSKGITIE